VATSRENEAAAPRITTLSAAQVLQKAANRSRADGTRLPIPRDDQYFSTRTYVSRTPVRGGKTRTRTDESWLSVDGSKPSRHVEHGKVHDDPPLGKHEVRWPPTAYAELKNMPADPDKLLHQLRLGQKSSPENDRAAFFEACMLMQGPRVMPPGLQAAAFEALARIPRVRLDQHEVDVLGRHGIGVSYPDAAFTFVFDPTTYDYLGLRTKGSSPKRVHGRWQQAGWYYETRSLEKVGVVDGIGRHPPGNGPWVRLRRPRP
jgi:hypothetical protein